MTNLGIYYQRIQPDAVFTPAAVYFNLVVPAENHLCLTLLRLNVSASNIACICFYYWVGSIRTSPYSTLCFLHTACSDTATKYNANKNASQFTIADDHDDNASVSSGISGSGKRRGKSQFESS